MAAVVDYLLFDLNAPQLHVWQVMMELSYPAGMALQSQGEAGGEWGRRRAQVVLGCGRAEVARAPEAARGPAGLQAAKGPRQQAAPVEAQQPAHWPRECLAAIPAHGPLEAQVLGQRPQLP